MFKMYIGLSLFVLLFGVMTPNYSEAQEMKREQEKSKTLRLLFPQWQGGNNKLYSLGAKLLAWLAPENNYPLVEVPVEPADETKPEKENGVVAQSALLKQLKSAQNIIDANKPDRIVVFGGDCLVSQAPFAYLNEKYEGKLGVLWIDAHPDVSTPEMYHHEHAMVLGNLLGEGDPKFSAEVKMPLKPAQIMYAGLGPTLEKEAEIIKRLRIKQTGAKELATDRDAVIHWIRDNNIQHLAIHFDLDVLDPTSIHSLYFSDPEAAPNAFDGVTQGKMTIEQVVRLISDASKETDVVGLSIAEHLPWDAQNLKNMLEQLPLLK